MADPPPGLSLGAAFDFFREAGERGLVGVSEGALLADAAAAPVLGVFSHRAVWRWARDQSQAVLGWQPLPFLDGRRAHLLWSELSRTGTIRSVVVGLSAAPAPTATTAGGGHDLDAVYPGPSEAAGAIRGHLRTLLTSPLSLRLRGGRGAGKDFVAAHLLDHVAAGRVDPLGIRGRQVTEHPVWVARLEEAVERRRPVHFRDIDQVPEARLHVVLPTLRRAHDHGVPVVATQSQPVSQFADRMWGKVFTTTVTLPGLDSRPEDIPALAQALWRANFGARSQLRLSRGALRLLAGTSWLGNVAELEAVLLDARARTGMDRIEAMALRVPARRAGSSARLEDVEAATIAETLRRTGGNRSEAAALLGISRSTLYRKLDALGPSRPGSR